MAELGRRLSYSEYREWQVYYAIEPFGEYRADLRAAVVSAASQAPHVRSGADMMKFLLFKEDRFDEPEQLEDDWDRVLDRAAARSQG